MIEQDYFMRMISMLTQMLAKIILHRDLKEFPQALLEIENTGKTLLGIDRTLIRQLSGTQLMQLFGSDLTVALPKSYVLAIILKEEADTRGLMGESEESAELYRKSLSLLLKTLLKSGEPIEERHATLIEEVLGCVDESGMTAELLEDVFRYHEYSGRYGKAEDTLYDILDLDPAFVVEGLGFYQRLLLKSDAELEAGGLPRDEVSQGIAAIERRRNVGSH